MRSEDHELEYLLKRAEKDFEQSKAEAAKYRELLRECCNGAVKAVRANNLEPIKEMLQQVCPILDEGTITEWGHSMLADLKRKRAWLDRATNCLENIKADIEKLDVEAGSTVAELKGKILDQIYDGLLTEL